MSSSRLIAESDLHAYVDSALDPARRAEIEAYLADHPDIAERVRRYEAQQRMLREALAPIAEEPIPPELDLAQLIERAHPREMRRRVSGLASWQAAAAALLLFCVGGAGGWLLRGTEQMPRVGVAALAQEAAENYAVYSPDRIHPVELRADDTPGLVAWLSQRLDSPVAVPDLVASGYRFMGGRLVATAHGPAGLFMYDNDHGTRLVMFVRRMEVQQTMPMSRYAGRSVDGFAWADNGVGYSLVGAAPPEILHPLADEVRRQIAGST
jgi:anti-sigma factor RsiW